VTDEPTTEARVVSGRYRLLSPVGTGGMGTVWRAEDLVLAREVAVKEVTYPAGLSHAEREILRERTRREARAAARLDHPSAVTVFDVVEEDGRPFLVMELVVARTLAEVVRDDGPLTPARTAEVGLAVLGALQAAHARGIVHRDVKPGNVLLRPPEQGDGRVVLTDFGIATSTGDSSLTSTGLLLGSPSYIAPERARGEPPGAPSDLWSLGATLFTAVEGRPPYDRGEPMSTLTAVVTDDREAYAAAGPLIPVLDGLLEADPQRRLSHEAARAQLRLVAQNAAAPAGPGVVGPARPEPTAGRRAEVTSALPVSAFATQPVPEQGGSGSPAAAEAPAPAAPAAVEPGPEADGADDPSTDGRRGLSRPPRTLAPEPTRQRRSRRPLLLAGLVALLLLGLGTVLLVRPGSSGGTGGQAAVAGPGSAAPSPAAPSPAATTSASPSASASPTPGPASASPARTPAASPAAGVPADWVAYRDPSGYSVSHPPGWTVGSFGGLRQLRDAKTSRVLRVDPSPLGTDSQLLASVSDTARTFAGKHAGYRQLQLHRSTFQGRSAVTWEFLYDEGGTRLHDEITNFNVGGKSYALQYQSPDADWASGAAVRAPLVGSFSAP